MLRVVVSPVGALLMLTGVIAAAGLVELGAYRSGRPAPAPHTLTRAECTGRCHTEPELAGLLVRKGVLAAPSPEQSLAAYLKPAFTTGKRPAYPLLTASQTATVLHRYFND